MEATPITIEIVPPEGAMIDLLAGVGEQKSIPYHLVAWTPPVGTRRERVGHSPFSTYWRIALPDGRQLLEIHVECTRLSLLFDIDPAVMADHHEEKHLQLI